MVRALSRGDRILRLPYRGRNSMTVVRFADAQQVQREPGIRSTLVVGPNIGSGRMSTGFTTFEPGAEVPPHRHYSEEAVMVVAGAGFCEVGGARSELRPLDTVYIPALVVHRFVNPGPGSMRIHWSRPAVNVERLPPEGEV
jgi:quercetin dioxygenase-like cupin family protein